MTNNECNAATTNRNVLLIDEAYDPLHDVDVKVPPSLNISAVWRVKTMSEYCFGGGAGKKFKGAVFNMEWHTVESEFKMVTGNRVRLITPIFHVEEWPISLLKSIHSSMQHGVTIVQKLQFDAWGCINSKMAALNRKCKQKYEFIYTIET